MQARESLHDQQVKMNFFKSQSLVWWILVAAGTETLFEVGLRVRLTSVELQSIFDSQGYTYENLKTNGLKIVTDLIKSKQCNICKFCREFNIEIPRLKDYLSNNGLYFTRIRLDAYSHEELRQIIFRHSLKKFSELYDEPIGIMRKLLSDIFNHNYFPGNSAWAKTGPSVLPDAPQTPAPLRTDIMQLAQDIINQDVPIKIFTEEKNIPEQALVDLLSTYKISYDEIRLFGWNYEKFHKKSIGFKRADFCEFYGISEYFLKSYLKPRFLRTYNQVRLCARATVDRNPLTLEDLIYKKQKEFIGSLIFCDLEVKRSHPKKDENQTSNSFEQDLQNFANLLEDPSISHILQETFDETPIPSPSQTGMFAASSPHKRKREDTPDEQLEIQSVERFAGV